MGHAAELSHVLTLAGDIMDLATGQAHSWCWELKARVEWACLGYTDKCCVHSGSTLRYQQHTRMQQACHYAGRQAH